MSYSEDLKAVKCESGNTSSSAEICFSCSAKLTADHIFQKIRKSKCWSTIRFRFFCPQGKAGLSSFVIKVLQDPVWVNKSRHWKVSDRKAKVIFKPAVITHIWHEWLGMFSHSRRCLKMLKRPRNKSKLGMTLVWNISLQLHFWGATCMHI